MLHDLNKRRRRLDREINDDRACTTCNYNLRGLTIGGKCPECATRITPPHIDPMTGWVITDAGFDYLRALSFGAILLVLCAPMILLGVVWTLIESPWTYGLTLWPGGGAIAAAVGWVLGVWVITTPRPNPEGPGALHQEWPITRWVSRGSQALWLLGTPVIVWGAHQLGEFHVNSVALHPLADFAVGVGAISWTLAFAGLAFLALYMSRLADWATDSSLRESLRLVPYALGIGGFLMGTLFILRGPIGYQGGGLIFMLAGCLGLILLLLAVGTFAYALMSFANLTRWTASSRRAKLAMEARRSQLILDRIESQKARPIDLDGAVIEGIKPSKPQGKVIEKAADAQPYDLA